MIRKSWWVLLISLCTVPGYGAFDGEDTAVFSPPNPPSLLMNRDERLNYLAAHYWARLNYADKAWPADSAALEQLFVDWLPLLGQLQPTKRPVAAATLITYGNEHPAMQKRLGELAERYLHDPNSPYRNEELYLPILEALIEAPRLKDIEKVRYRYQRQKALMNRPGTKAADLALVTRENRTIRLAAVDSEWILLFFFNPDCHACQTTAGSITRSALCRNLSERGKMKVVALYPDEDLSAWEKHKNSFSKRWLVARYAGAADREAYDLPAIPTLYLLDSEKKVILKDATMEQIEERLRR